MGKFFKKVGIAAAIGLSFGILAAFGFAGVTRVINTFFPSKAEVSAKIETVTDDEGDKTVEARTEVTEKAQLAKAVDDGMISSAGGEIGMSVTELAKNNLPCVVSITNTTVQTFRDMWSGGEKQYENVSRGSGIIIGQTDDELLIATNSHVVNGANSITVGFVDSEIYDAAVKGADSEVDLAVIGVKKSDLKSSTLDAVKVAVIGDSSKLEVGEQVVAIGNAVGVGQSVTTGIVSALDRSIPGDESDARYIQTDAAINPGNSGGALLNMKGEVIGINTAKAVSTYVEGMGYAIPMEKANSTIEFLMNRKTRDKVDEDKAGYLGITGVSVDAQTSAMYGIPEGIYLQEIVKDSPAEDAGLLKGDVIKKFDGISVSTIAELRNNLDYYEAGEKVELVICRQEDGEYKDKTVTVTLTTKKDVGFEDEKKDDSSADDKKDPDKKDAPEDNKPGNDENSQRDFYNSLPDEFRDFFYGFGR